MCSTNETQRDSSAPILDGSCREGWDLIYKRVALVFDILVLLPLTLLLVYEITYIVEDPEASYFGLLFEAITFVSCVMSIYGLVMNKCCLLVPQIGVLLFSSGSGIFADLLGGVHSFTLPLFFQGASFVTHIMAIRRMIRDKREETEEQQIVVQRAQYKNHDLEKQQP